MKNKTILITILIFMWLITLPIAYFEGVIDPKHTYYTACLCEVFTWTMGMLTGYMLFKNNKEVV